MHETLYRDTVQNIEYFKSAIKGELTVVISQKYNKNKVVLGNDDLKKQAITYLKKYSLKDVVELISKKENVSKKIIYEMCLKLKK